MGNVYNVTRESTQLIMGENVFPIEGVVETVEVARLGGHEIEDYARTSAWGTARDRGSDNNVTGAAVHDVAGRGGPSEMIDFSKCRGGGIKMAPATVARFIAAAELSFATRGN